MDIPVVVTSQSTETLEFRASDLFGVLFLSSVDALPNLTQSLRDLIYTSCELSMRCNDSDGQTDSELALMYLVTGDWQKLKSQIAFLG